MHKYTFCIDAYATVEADSEAAARELLLKTLSETDEDVPYGDAMVYCPSIGAAQAELVDIDGEETDA